MVAAFAPPVLKVSLVPCLNVLHGPGTLLLDGRLFANTSKLEPHPKASRPMLFGSGHWSGNGHTFGNFAMLYSK
jgi:hypothetical protein